MKTAKEFAKEAVERGIISAANETELERLMLHYMEELFKDHIDNSRSGWMIPVSPITECNHDYEAIYIGVGYVKQCRNCGHIIQ